MRRPASLMRIALAAALVFAGSATAGISGKYVGRYQCGQWNPLELQVDEQGGGRLVGVFTFQLRAPGQSGNASYSMTGHYDAASGRFELMPDRWIGRRPIGVNMVGLQGTVDAAAHRLAGKVSSFNCGEFEVAPPGMALSQPTSPTQPAANLPPEHRPAPGDVTGLASSFEYWDAAMADAPGTVRESEPIDDVIDWLRKSGFSCMDSTHVSWDPRGATGSASDVVQVRERYVVECNGNCRGVRYLPAVSAQIVHFGASQPVPVLELKSPWLGGSKFQWNFTRDDPSQPPPDVYIHRWTSSGFNAKGACRAPKADHAAGAQRSSAPPTINPRTRRPY